MFEVCQLGFCYKCVFGPFHRCSSAHIEQFQVQEECTYWTISSSRVLVLLWCSSPNRQFLVSWSLFLLGFLRFVWNLDAWALLRCFMYGLFLKVATTNYLKTNVSILISKVKMLTLVFMIYASLEFASNPLFGPIEFVFAFNIRYKCFLLCILGCMLYNGHRFFVFLGSRFNSCI